MGELVIKTHDFEVAKQGLKEFSQKNAEELEINTVKTDGGFLGLGDHKVTGDELNNRLRAIQQHLIDLNETNNRTIKEFGQVYGALEALDKDYIQAILVSIKATEKTSESIAAAQERITQIVEDQRKTLEILKKFKQRLDGYTHLGDIDKMWNDCQKWYQESKELSNSIDEALYASQENTAAIQKLEELQKAVTYQTTVIENTLDQQISQMQALLDFTTELEKIIHLHDVDAMWDSLSGVHNSINSIIHDIDSMNSLISEQQSNIGELLAFVDILSTYQHLKDVDDLWASVQKNSSQLSSLAQMCRYLDDSIKGNSSRTSKLEQYQRELSEINHLHDVDVLWNTSEQHTAQFLEIKKYIQRSNYAIKANKAAAEAAFAVTEEKRKSTELDLIAKIKIAYWIAGGSLGLALIEMLIIIMQVV